MSKILFIAGNARSLIANRGDLIAELKCLGHHVSALVPAYDALPELDEMDIHYELVELNRPGMNPWYDFQYCIELTKRIKRLAPDIVFSYNIKPVIFGSIAAWLAGIPRITSMITGLGYLYTGNSWSQRLGRLVAQMLYCIALPLNNVIFFQNPDDHELFDNNGLLRRVQNTVIVNGSGVNLERFTMAPLSKGPPRFLLIARLLKDKGIGEFVEAARRIKRKYPEVSFEVVGPYDGNLPRSIPLNQIEEWKSYGCVVFHPGVKDVRPYLISSSIFVLPSYREGTPRTVLEAMAIGRPIITTDAPGCRETVLPGVNGFLVQVGDIDQLENAMLRFIVDPIIIPRMGRESRRFAETKYDVNKVNTVIIENMLRSDI